MGLEKLLLRFKVINISTSNWVYLKYWGSLRHSKPKQFRIDETWSGEKGYLCYADLQIVMFKRFEYLKYLYFYLHVANEG